MKKNFLMVWVFIISFFIQNGVTTAQVKTLKLSLSKAIEIALEENHEIKLTQNQLSKIKAERNKTLSLFFPEITLSETFMRTNNPLNSFGFKLQQEIVKQSDFNPMLLNNPAIINNYNSKIEIKQPLINIDGFFGRASAAKGVEALKHKVIRTKEFIEFQVKASYFNLVLAKKSLGVIEKALVAAGKGRNTAKNYFEKGYLNKAEYLSAEVYLLNIESKKAELMNNYNVVQNNFKFLLGISSEAIIEPSDTLQKKNVLNKKYSIENINYNRSDMVARKKQISALENATTMEYLKFIPRINAFANYQYNNKDLFKGNQTSWLAGINLEWKIFNGFKNIANIQVAQANLNKAKIELEKTKLQNRIEIEEALGNLETAEKKLLLSSNAVKQSNESLKIMRDRYDKGLEKTSDLLRVESENSTSKLNHLKTLYYYNLSIYKAELLLGKKISQ